MLRICPICSQAFVTYPSENKKYCSLTCAGEGRRRFIRGANHPNWRGGQITATCAVCRKPFRHYPYEKGSRVACSLRCQALWQKENRSGPAAPNWNGGKTISSGGYRHIKAPGHPRANKGGYVPEQILVAEKALGKYLPARALVHHVNGVRTDNRNANLVICEDASYHGFLHQRARSLRIERVV